MKLLLLLLFSLNVFGEDIDKHPIYSQIIKNQPKINKKYAMKLSNILYRVAHKYHIPSRIFTAILMQESRYQLGAKGCHRGVRELTDVEKRHYLGQCAKQSLIVKDYYFPEKCSQEVLSRKTETRICSDFGISQIYYKTAKSFKFDINLLTTDLEYSVEAGAKVLSDFQKRYEDREVTWWTRYNSSSKTKRRIYKELVSRYF